MCLIITNSKPHQTHLARIRKQGHVLIPVFKIVNHHSYEPLGQCYPLHGVNIPYKKGENRAFRYYPYDRPNARPSPIRTKPFKRDGYKVDQGYFHFYMRKMPYSEYRDCHAFTQIRCFIYADELLALSYTSAIIPCGVASRIFIKRLPTKPRKNPYAGAFTAIQIV